MARYRRTGLRRLRGPNGRLAGSAVAAGLVLAVAAGHAHASASGAHLAAGAGGTLDCSQLEGLWKAAGGSASAASMAAQIAQAESSGRQYATLHNTNGSTDRGYWQINSVHGALSTYDAAGNARAAVLISGNGRDWTPWTAYRTGAYAGRC
jgi:Lysozyme like domain